MDILQPNVSVFFMFFDRGEDDIALKEATHRFSELYDLHKDALFSLAVSILRNRADAEDVLQTVFQKVWKDRSRWKQVLQWKAWLLQLTRNASLDFLKRHSRARNREEDAFDGYFLESKSTNDAHQLDQLHDLLGQLDEPSRSLVLLKYVQELTFEEVGEIFKIPASTAATRHYDAMKRLKTLWVKTEKIS
jgi:RNA polymerase sigma-70 factor, ECF subfamily